MDKRVIEMHSLDKLPDWISRVQKEWKLFRRGNNLNGDCIEQSLVETGTASNPLFMFTEKWILHKNRRLTHDDAYFVTAHFRSYGDVNSPGELTYYYEQYNKGNYTRLWYKYEDMRLNPTPLGV